MLEVPHDDVPDILDLPAVRPLQPCVLGWNMLKIGDPWLPAYSPAFLKVLGVEESFQVQIVGHTSLDVADIVPTVQPCLYLPVLLPVMHDVPLLVSQPVKEHALSVEEPHLPLKDSRSEIVLVKDVPKVDGEVVVVAERHDLLSADGLGQLLPVPLLCHPEHGVKAVVHPVGKRESPSVVQPQDGRVVGYLLDSAHTSISFCPLNVIRSGW